MFFVLLFHNLYYTNEIICVLHHSHNKWYKYHIIFIIYLCYCNVYLFILFFLFLTVQYTCTYF